MSKSTILCQIINRLVQHYENVHCRSFERIMHTEMLAKEGMKVYSFLAASKADWMDCLPSQHTDMVYPSPYLSTFLSL